MFITINAVPYNAAINAHEDFYYDAFIGILESLLKLLIAYYLMIYIGDRLVLFAILTIALTFSVRIAKSVFCHRKYDECSFNIVDGRDRNPRHDSPVQAVLPLGTGIRTRCNFLLSEGLPHRNTD